MKGTLVTILILAALIVGGGLLIDSIADNGSATLLNAVANKNQRSSTELKNYGPAPEFAGIVQWLNSDPLTMQSLRGKVVLIDFWTYSCINCIRTLPYVTGWSEKYKDQGLVVVGVHTPEFAFEKETTNVQTAIKRHKINYPVAQDNDFATWNAYNNQYWPAHYLIDQNGNVVYYHFGEGKYQETEQAIQQLLGLSDEAEMAEQNTVREVKTPEIYFGLKRQEWLSKDQQASNKVKSFSLPAQLQLNTFGLAGPWSFSDEGAQLEGSSGKIRLKYYSKDLHIVARSAHGSKVKVFIDGELVNTVDIRDSSLYTLFEGDDSKERLLELEIDGEGFEAYTFTFG
jgi:thiol-disulfide isomerase/thioredoxin